MLVEIRSRWADQVLFSGEYNSLKSCVEAAVKRGADLREADLRGAYLRGANLRGADLRGAYLRGADLSEAYLRGADLRVADLSEAYLSKADLSKADLSEADLRGADLIRANLIGANLIGAYLIRANLSEANLSEAHLRGADLRGAKNCFTHHWLPQIQGSRHFVCMSGERTLKIGCISNSIDWWLENSEKCGIENGYTPEQIVEYRRYIELIAAMYPAQAE